MTTETVLCTHDNFDGELVNLANGQSVFFGSWAKHEAHYVNEKIVIDEDNAGNATYYAPLQSQYNNITARDEEASEAFEVLAETYGATFADVFEIFIKENRVEMWVSAHN